MVLNKVEMFWEGAACVKVSTTAMKTIAMLAESHGMDAIYDRLVDGDFNTIAQWISECEGYDGPSVEALERELMDDEVFTVEVERYERSYRMAADGDGIIYHIVGFGDKGLRLEVREAIENHFKGMDGFDESKPMMWNVYNTFATACRRRRTTTICRIRSGNKREQQPDLGDDGGQPTPDVPERTVIREKVIIKEQPAELESLLRQALVQQLVQLNLNEVHETIKKRLVDDFGFEPQRHVVKHVDIEREVDDVVHEKFDEVCHYVANDIPSYLYGPAGSGKGVLGRQVAEALGLEYHFMTSVTDEFKINGYMDAYGTYHETPFYKAFKNGGVFFLDEMDASAPEVLVCLNMAISDRRYTFPHETLEAHPDFRVIAAGNTLGTGADASYTGRMQLDAASLNRFVVVEVDYDERIDMMCAGGDAQLVEFAKAFRKVVREIGLPTVCSYRNISQLRVAKEAVPMENAFQSCLCKEMNQDDINIVAERMGLGGNDYAKAFKNVKAIVG